MRHPATERQRDNKACVVHSVGKAGHALDHADNRPVAPAGLVQRAFVQVRVEVIVPDQDRAFVLDKDGLAAMDKIARRRPETQELRHLVASANRFDQFFPGTGEFGHVPPECHAALLTRGAATAILAQPPLPPARPA